VTGPDRSEAVVPDGIGAQMVGEEGRMDAAAREALGRLVEGADVELLGDARRIRGWLQDACPQSRREVMTLVAAAEEGLPLRLQKLPAGGMVPEELGRLAVELARVRGLDPVVASWAVGAWAWALGVGPVPAEEQQAAEAAVAVSVPPPAAEPEQTPQGGIGLRPQRPPPSPPVPEVTQDREPPERPKRRRRLMSSAAAVVVGILLASTAVVVGIAGRPGGGGVSTSTGARPTTTSGNGATTTSLPLPKDARAILFNDDFSTQDNKWVARTVPQGRARYLAGAFRFHVARVRQTMGAGPRMFILEGADARVRVEVSARRLAGATDAGYGVLCRRDDRTDSHYEAQVTDDGGYIIQKRLHHGWQIMAQGSNAALVNKGKANLLRLDCTGGQRRQPVTLALSVNGHLLKEVDDRREPLAPAGGVGLVTSTYQHAPIDVEFDDFIVYALRPTSS
jgi:hypothetical protein